VEHHELVGEARLVDEDDLPVDPVDAAGHAFIVARADGRLGTDRRRRAGMPDVIALTLSMLRTSVDRWAAIARVDAELLSRRPAPGEWAALQALQHVVDAESAVFHARVLAIRAGEAFRAFDPDSEGHVDRVALSAAELVEQLRQRRAESLATLETLTAADLDRVGTHAELGPVTMAELLNEWAAHDTMHIVQAERALMQPFIPNSGPWRRYFTDHDVERDPAE
jgi:hypothetical protein